MKTTLVTTCHLHPDCSGCTGKLAVRTNGLGFFIGNPEVLDHLCRPTDYFDTAEMARAELETLRGA